MIKLGVNIDHVATLRQARGTPYPSPVQAALMAESAGADSITLHLREDRRHIQDEDVRMLRRLLTTRMNLEMAVTDEMVAIALDVLPQDVCLVPERRQELTTEGGLDVVAHYDRVADTCRRLGMAGIRVSLFIDAEVAQLEAARRAGAPVVEIHTGRYAEAGHDAQAQMELERIRQAVHMGRVEELNIGHAIVAQALFVGWERAVADMKRLMVEAAASA